MQHSMIIAQTPKKIENVLLAKKLKKPIKIGHLTGFITDCHIYENSFKKAKAMIEEYNKKKKKNLNNIKE